MGMTRNKSADSDLTLILDDLPRDTPVNDYPKMDTNAWVYIDSTGDLHILPETGGLLLLRESNLGFLETDLAPFCD